MGVVNKRTELCLLLIGKAGAKYIINLFLDYAGAIIKNMIEGIIFSMQIGKKMLNTLRQAQLRRKMNQPLIDSLPGGILLCQQLHALFLI